jgi:hypothetical protein
MSLCPGCGLDGVVGVHPYEGSLNASSECWSLYLGVLAAEYEDAGLFVDVHQLTLDVYAAQHAGPKQTDRAVARHLVGLHLVLERDVEAGAVPQHLERLARKIPVWPRFEAPREKAAMTVLDVANARSPREHAAIVRRWARTVWGGWSTHHAAIGELAERSLVRRYAMGAEEPALWLPSQPNRSKRA